MKGKGKGRRNQKSSSVRIERAKKRVGLSEEYVQVQCETVLSEAEERLSRLRLEVNRLAPQCPTLLWKFNVCNISLRRRKPSFSRKALHRGRRIQPPNAHADEKISCALAPQGQCIRGHQVV